MENKQSVQTSHSRKSYGTDYIKIHPNVKYDVFDRNLLRSYSFRMNFGYDSKFFKIRPKGNPLPLIVEELHLMLGDFEQAKNCMDNFFKACANIYDKGKHPFYVIIEDFISNTNNYGGETKGATNPVSTVEHTESGTIETNVGTNELDVGTIESNTNTEVGTDRSSQ